ncbi:hypothetical protein A3A93_04865 [Candidatus Roizmanbacteria bacterium RIFCSPLOWO2_01_FULL_38_12]|uniref:Uncharacterized protein n=1 Tax=Candidatus Roizmanbacteria bacterium RIFCSPLOWO2_01_FULL_38_12 TaxID=1802061 RepID=A0A1F7IVY5_9BACT|nr:MAG: hypothetical protein A3F59_06115 [Candidatus Roizmanbacteria bacterium RIFCSPHIGHO2_12_FULL_38_13]OGK47540.1 MAG: hypothetical protein A3A93_04865 [Candidatus Roizmanbacteria bacterium RIFCSPLOWO2_01_FULL_38_12]
MEIFAEITIIIMVATLVAAVAKMLRQPLIIGYILSGIILGPSFLNVIQNSQVIEVFSKLGITVLLFIVGINLNPQVIRDVGKVSFISGISQVVFTSIIGFFLARFLGLDNIASLYVAIALTFSSTIIILKLLSDKGDLNKLYGRIAIGFLIVQDIIATIILLVTSAAGSSSGAGLFLITLITLIKGILLISAVMLISSYLLPKINEFSARSQELLFIFSLSWGLGMALLFYTLGFSVEIGALVGGVAMSMSPYSIEIVSRLRPLRDFFIVLFFILLGSQMVLGSLVNLLLPAVVLSVFVLIGNPVIMIIIMNLLGYSKRTSFFTGLTVAQISEFSLILGALGFQLGHLSRDTLSLITLVALITIVASTYMILYGERVYPRLTKLLSLLSLRKNKGEQKLDEEYEAILFGYQRVGADFVKAFERLGFDFIVVDFNPDAIKYMKEEKIPYKFGDAKDAEFLAELDLKNLLYVVSTIPENETNNLLIQKIRDVNKRAIVLVVAQTRDEANKLYKSGATYVIMPHYLGAQYATKIIREHGVNRQGYSELKSRHLKYLETLSV